MVRPICTFNNHGDATVASALASSESMADWLDKTSASPVFSGSERCHWRSCGPIGRAVAKVKSLVFVRLQLQGFIPPELEHRPVELAAVPVFVGDVKSAAVAHAEAAGEIP